MMAQGAQQVVRKQHTYMSHRVDVRCKFTTADRIFVARKGARAPRRDGHNGVEIVVVRVNLGRPFLIHFVLRKFINGPFLKNFRRC